MTENRIKDTLYVANVMQAHIFLVFTLFPISQSHFQTMNFKKEV